MSIEANIVLTSGGRYKYKVEIDDDFNGSAVLGFNEFSTVVDIEDWTAFKNAVDDLIAVWSKLRSEVV